MFIGSFLYLVGATFSRFASFNADLYVWSVMVCACGGVWLVGGGVFRVKDVWEERRRREEEKEGKNVYGGVWEEESSS